MAHLTQTDRFLLPDVVDDDPLPAPRQTSDRRRVAMAVLAGVALVGSVLGLGLDGLIMFGVLLAFSADPDEPDPPGKAITDLALVGWMAAATPPTTATQRTATTKDLS